MPRLRRIVTLKKVALGMMVALEATYLFGLGVATATDAGFSFSLGEVEASNAVIAASDAVRYLLPVVAIFGLAAIWLLWKESIWAAPVWAATFLLKSTVWIGLGQNLYHAGGGGLVLAAMEILVIALLVQLFFDRSIRRMEDRRKLERMRFRTPLKD